MMCPEGSPLALLRSLYIPLNFNAPHHLHSVQDLCSPLGLQTRRANFIASVR